MYEYYVERCLKTKTTLFLVFKSIKRINHLPDPRKGVFPSPDLMAQFFYGSRPFYVVLLLRRVYWRIPHTCEAFTTTTMATPLFCVVFLLFFTSVFSWYERYEAYPPYCSTPEEMATRGIPPIRPNVHLGDSRLAHVTAVVRHGARTPWSSGMSCWDGYWQSGDTGVWDCALTTFLAPPTPRVVNEEKGVYGSQTDSMFLFEKKYDALKYPQRNEMNGTCQKGQLLLQGYDQELQNGQILRSAYVFDGKEVGNHDIQLRLLDLSDDTNRPYQEPILRYRSDDDQRTLMSGQVLLRGLFGTEFVDHAEKYGQAPIIPLHVADRSRDILDANIVECPRLATLQQKAFASVEFQAFNNSEESKTIRRFIASELGSLQEPLDCLMTTICTDRTLPDAINDYHGPGDRELHPGHTHKTTNCNSHSRVLHPGHEHSEGDGDDDDDDDDDDGDGHCGKYGSNLFDRVTKFDIISNVFPFLYDKSELSKVAMGPLWSEILDPIMPILTGGDRGAAANKLHVISGHDSTIIPLLASIGVWNLDDWPLYASMMLLEVHELVDGKTDRTVYPSTFAFRLLYNGKVLTDKVAGCHAEYDLCDFTVLQKLLEPFAVRLRNCAADPVLTKSALVENAQGLLSSSGGIFVVLLVVAFSAGIGSLATLWYQQTSQANRGGRYLSVYENSDGIGHADPPLEKTDEPTMLVV
jgi:hypothetical protein